MPLLRCLSLKKFYILSKLTATQHPIVRQKLRKRQAVVTFTSEIYASSLTCRILCSQTTHLKGYSNVWTAVCQSTSYGNSLQTLLSWTSSIQTQISSQESTQAGIRPLSVTSSLRTSMLKQCQQRSHKTQQLDKTTSKKPKRLHSNCSQKASANQISRKSFTTSLNKSWLMRCKS